MPECGIVKFVRNLFGIKVLREEVLRLAKEVKQLQCSHPEKDSIFKAEYVCGFLSRSKECGICGKTIASYISDCEYTKAKAEHLRQEAERLHPLTSEAEAKWPEVILKGHEERERKRKTFADSVAAQAQYQNAYFRSATEEMNKRREQKEKGEAIFDGDYIKKVKGRWVHVRSGKVLKVRK